MTDLSSVQTEDLIEELKTRSGITVYPRWVTPDDVFGNRLTMPGSAVLLKFDTGWQ